MGDIVRGRCRRWTVRFSGSTIMKGGRLKFDKDGPIQMIIDIG